MAEVPPDSYEQPNADELDEIQRGQFEALEARKEQEEALYAQDIGNDVEWAHDHAMNVVDNGVHNADQPDFDSLPPDVPVQNWEDYSAAAEEEEEALPDQIYSEDERMEGEGGAAGGAFGA
ncbi:hypothetical protein ACFL10_01435 [Patescibacteria group bacterium]